MRAFWSWRVTVASIAFLISISARAQAAPAPGDGGTDATAPSESATSSPATTPPPETAPSPTSTPESVVAPEAVAPPPAPEPKVVAEPVKPAPLPPPKDGYRIKGLKPQKLAKHYGFAPNFHWEVLGYFFYGLNVGSLNNKNGGMAFGGRAHLDFGHLALFGQFERFASDSNGNPLVYDQGKVMLGVVPTITPYGRFRILAGMDILTTGGANAGILFVSPIFGLSGRLGNGMFGLDVSSIFGIYPVFQMDARAAFVIRIFFVQLHLGYQISYRTAGPGLSPGLNGMIGNGDEFVKVGPIIHGPQAALGFGW